MQFLHEFDNFWRFGFLGLGGLIHGRHLSLQYFALLPPGTNDSEQVMHVFMSGPLAALRRFSFSLSFFLLLLRAAFFLQMLEQ